MDGEAGWWTTSGNIGLPPLARAMGVGRQQQHDLIGVNIDRECTDVNIVVHQYDASLSSLLDKHAPSKRIYVVDRPMNDWMTDDILVLKALRRKYESLWRKTHLTVHFRKLYGCKKAISKSKSIILQKKVSDCNGDQKKLFKIVDTLLGRNKEATLPKYDSPLTMASVMKNKLIKLTIFELSFHY